MQYITEIKVWLETWIAKATEYYDVHNTVIDLLPWFARVHILDFSLIVLSVFLFAWLLIKKLINS